MKSNTDMNAPKDGGPAFPNNCTNWRDIPNHPAPGMTLRDWMAGMALSGMLANPEYSGASDSSMAEYSYDQADAMLAARERKGDA